MTRIITLGPVNSTPTNVTFEEAFGEFSEARGKGRARRAARRADRTEKRKTRKLDRIQARDEVKEARQESRSGRRARRNVMRSEQQAARQDRKNVRFENRMARKDARGKYSENNADLEQGLDQGVEQEMGQTQDQGYAPQEQGGYDSGYSDQGYSDQGYSDQGYAPQEQVGYDSGYSDQGYADQGGGYDASYTNSESPYDYGNDETGGNSDYGNDYGNDYESDYSETNDIPEGGDFNFDGVMGAEDRFNELSDGSVSVKPEIQSIADKLEWNKELVSRLEEKRESSNVNPQDISKVIVMRTERIEDLGSKLDDYYNACGEYSCFDSSDEKGRENRAMEITHAKRKARKKLHVNKELGGANRFNRRTARPPMNSDTPVQKSLNPHFSPNRIVVDAKSNATGINGLDLVDDFDAPRVREIQLGADGSKTSSIKWGSVLLGVGIGIGAIWAIKKYNLLK
jgi:hypothetical protein